MKCCRIHVNLTQNLRSTRVKALRGVLYSAGWSPVVQQRLPGFSDSFYALCYGSPLYKRLYGLPVILLRRMAGWPFQRAFGSILSRLLCSPYLQ